jgi:hypothetical protein
VAAWLCSLSLSPLLGQITIGRVHYRHETVNFMKLQKEDVEYLRNATGYFAYRAADSADLPKFKQAIEEGWTFGKIHMIPYDSVRRYKIGTNTYIIDIRLVNKVKYESDGTVHDFGNMAALQFWRYVRGKTSKQSYIRAFASVDLYYDATDGINQSDLEKMKFFNYSPGFLKAYLACVQRYFESNQTVEYDTEMSEKDDLAELKSNTLYIPEYAMFHRDPKTGKMGKRFEEAELLGPYPYKYEILPAASISDKILSGENCYYLCYVKQGSAKYFTVYRARDSKMLFQRYKKIGYNISDRDFKDLAGDIK